MNIKTAIRAITGEDIATILNHVPALLAAVEAAQ